MSSLVRHVATSAGTYLIGLALIVTAAAPAAALRAIIAPRERAQVTCPVSDILIVRKRTTCGVDRPACA